MSLKMDSDVKSVTVLKGGDGGTTRSVYRRHSEDDDRQPIKHVTVIKRDESGQIISRDAYKGERETKKQSRALKPIERKIRKVLEFQSDVINNYLGRHTRSNAKRRDGWLRDMPNNLVRAVRKSKPKRLFKMSRSRD